VTPTVAYVAAIIKKLEDGEQIKWRAADPMIWRRQTGNMDNQTIEYFFAKAGIFFTPGAPDYNSRINAVQQLLANDCIKISPQCPQTVVAYQQYRWQDLKVNSDRDRPDKPLKKGDHLVDADQYFFTLFSSGVKPPEAKKPWSWDSHVKNAIQAQVKRYSKRSTGPE
jgi:hypothetical protein